MNKIKIIPLILLCLLLITLSSLNNYRVLPVFRNNLGLLSYQTSDGEESRTSDYWSLFAYADKGSDEVDEESGSKGEEEEDGGEQENSQSSGSTLQEAPQGRGLQVEAEEGGGQEKSNLSILSHTGCPKGVICIAPNSTQETHVSIQADTAEHVKALNTIESIPGDLGDGSQSFGGNTNSRLELTNKVSSEQELLSILEKFKNFMDTDPSVFAPYPENLSLGKVTTGPTGALNIYYSWEPQSVIQDKYSILMLKFMDDSGQLVKKKIDYNILISNGSNSEFQKYGSTSTAMDLKIIDEKTFPTKSTINPVDYSVKINVPSVNDVPVNESAQPMKVPQNP